MDKNKGKSWLPELEDRNPGGLCDGHLPASLMELGNSSDGVRMPNSAQVPSHGRWKEEKDKQTFRVGGHSSEP